METFSHIYLINDEDGTRSRILEASLTYHILDEETRHRTWFSLDKAELSSRHWSPVSFGPDYT